MKTTLLQFSALALCGFAAMTAHAGVTLKSGEITGIVVDRSTNQAIPGAIVTAKWFGGWRSLSATPCERAVAIVSDSAGMFTIAAWTTEDREIQDLGVQVAAYHPRYQALRQPATGAGPKRMLGLAQTGEIELSPASVRVEMERTSDDPEARATYLRGFIASVDCPGGVLNSMAPLEHAMRREVAGFPAEVRDARQGPTNATLFDLIDHGYRERPIARKDLRESTPSHISAPMR
jgi:hypothetical protein